MKSTRLKLACYTANVGIAIVANISPILFITFQNIYDISYSLLGLIVLVNFITQLSMDLIFSFFSHKFRIEKVVKINPVITAAGLITYALWPIFFPSSAYIGIITGTFLFSISGGFSEVLISPIISAAFKEDSEREVSKLHSVYAFGVVFVILISNLVLLVFGQRNWYLIPLSLTLVPISSFILFSRSKIPEMEKPSHLKGTLKLMRNRFLWVCIILIFLGGAAEVNMAQWSSVFLEQGLGIPKIWGDIFGVALFSVMLGIGRYLYSRIGKNITRVLLIGCIGACICYLTVALCDIPYITVTACALTGLFVSMLWPGSLIVASDRIPSGGVFIFAIMAAGGDLGGSVAPQLTGIITDAVIGNPKAAEIAAWFGFTTEQLGMKFGIIVGMLFPLIAIPILIHIIRKDKKLSK